MLRLYRNHSAFNSHNFPRTCTTTYLFSMLLCHSNRHAPTRDACRFGTYLVSSGCTYGLVTVSFHSFCIEVSFDAVSAQSFARPLAGLLATHLAIVFSVNSAYLPGLHSARPSAFVEGDGFEPPLTAKFSRLLPIYRSLPSLRSLCLYGIETLILTASCWSSLTTLHLSFIISPDAIILCILCFG